MKEFIQKKKFVLLLCGLFVVTVLLAYYFAAYQTLKVQLGNEINSDNFLNGNVGSDDKGLITKQDTDETIADSDKSYKLFYGEWEVTQIIAGNARWGVTEEAKTVVGTSYYFNSEEIKKNGEVVSHQPVYSYRIIPLTNIEFFHNYPSMMSLGFKGEYFVYVTVNLGDDIPSFFIKNDSTLIFFESGALFEMKRKSHIENVTYYYSFL